jgi:hypothetical protein
VRIKSNHEIRKLSQYYINTFGDIDKVNNEISKAINNLSKESDAINNVNQILFYSRVLFYLRYEYKLINN